MAEVDLSLEELAVLAGAIEYYKIDIDNTYDEENTWSYYFFRKCLNDLSSCREKLSKAFQEELNNRLKDEE